MRHLLSLLLGLVIAPAVWIAAGLGQAKLAQVTETGITLRGATVPLAVLAAAGLVFGIVAATRISPVGPLVAGLLLVGVQVAYLARPERITELASRDLFGAENPLLLPAATGLGAVLGVGLMVALFSRGRWRTWPGDDMPAYAFLGDSGPVSTSSTKTHSDESTDMFPSKVSDDTTASLAGASAGSESTSSWAAGPAWRREDSGT